MSANRARPARLDPTTVRTPEEALTVLRREWRTTGADDRAEIEAIARAVHAVKDGMDRSTLVEQVREVELTA